MHLMSPRRSSLRLLRPTRGSSNASACSSPQPPTWHSISTRLETLFQRHPTLALRVLQTMSDLLTRYGV